MDLIHIGGTDLTILAILCLWLGHTITDRVKFLQTFSIPIAVTGGLVFSISAAILSGSGGPSLDFDLSTRDFLLLIFFSTIGLSAKFSQLKSGGKCLGILVVCAAVFLVVQNVTGVVMASLLGGHPGLGLFAGSVSLAGGHGTAIAWGEEAAAAGIEGAELAGIAFATFGLIAGGIIGGPMAERLIKIHKLVTPSDASESENPQKKTGSEGKDEGIVPEPFSLRNAFQVLMILSLCVSIGDVVNRWLFQNDLKLPGFLTAMVVGIVLTNLTDKTRRPLRLDDFDKVGQVSLQLFLAMSLMSMDLTALAGAFGVIFLILTVQIVVITFFASQLIFRLMGRDYDAAVIAGGFCGLGMGATPVAIANMSAITGKYGPSFKAFLVIPLVGAFFIDILNAIVIKFFLGLPMMTDWSGAIFY